MEKKQVKVVISFGPEGYKVVCDPEPVQLEAEHPNEVKEESEVKYYHEGENVTYYIKTLAEKYNCSVSDMMQLLRNMWKIYPVSALSLLLREIAIELDKDYPDHISNCPFVFIISTADGRIHKLYKAQIKSYRNFAAFRTENDARIACRILRPLLKLLFKNDRK